MSRGAGRPRAAGGQEDRERPRLRLISKWNKKHYIIFGELLQIYKKGVFKMFYKRNGRTLVGWLFIIAVIIVICLILAGGIMLGS